MRTYDAFGNVVSSSGTWNGPFGNGGAFGYQEDATGLKLLGHRYYDSSIGRFLTRDPIKDGRNWYAYCGNDPVNRADPSGLVPRPLNDEERAYVDQAIAEIEAVEPDYGKLLRILFNAGGILVDDEATNSTTTQTHIILNKAVFATLRLESRGGMPHDAGLARLEGYLVHEFTHYIDIALGYKLRGGNTDYTEDNAYGRELQYLSKLRAWRVAHGRKPEAVDWAAGHALAAAKERLGRNPTIMHPPAKKVTRRKIGE
jgi:RHS repeat-associated protein